MNNYQIIQKLGGATKVGKRLGVSRTSVDAWKYHSIPPKYWEQLIEFANEPRFSDLSREVFHQANVNRKAAKDV